MCMFCELQHLLLVVGRYIVPDMFYCTGHVYCAGYVILYRTRCVVADMCCIRHIILYRTRFVVPAMLYGTLA